MDPVRVVLDAMGGDFAPEREAEGAALALAAFGPMMDLTLVGNAERVGHALDRAGVDGTRLTILPATQVIAMDDPPTAALRQKKDSSLSVGILRHKEGKADAFVSAGNTGAVLSASTLILGRLKGVSRPTIGAFFPAEDGTCLVVDAGTNVDCRAQHLYEFGVMGSTYFRLAFGKDRPTVGLLNVGHERGKGTDVINEAYTMLESGPVNFIGNVEGRDILKAGADVVVCDGFVGNIVLKFGESVPSFLKSALSRTARSSFIDALRLLIARGTMRRSLRVLDPNEYGGVPILGVNGISIIGHGSSTSVGIKNMIGKAIESARSRLHVQIESALAVSTAGKAGY